ncbi:hypothetical protein KIPE111705_26880 [Kibdelosporangium persicum]
MVRRPPLTRRYHSNTVIEARHRTVHAMPEIVFAVILVAVFVLIALTLRFLEKRGL